MQVAKLQLVDAEIHLGTGLVSPKSSEIIDGDIKTFSEQIKNLNIRGAIAIPAPTFRLKMPNGDIEESCFWRRDEKGKIVYEKILIRDGKRTILLNPSKPYFNMNESVLETIKRENAKRKEAFFHFVPIFHPKLDVREDIERFLEEKLTVAMKIHGIGTHSEPTDVPSWVGMLLRRYDKPIFVHTDLSLKKIFRSEEEKELSELRNLNRASGWIRWAINNKVRIYLAHGCGMLEEETVKMINNADGIVTGVGPDLVINLDRSRIEEGNDYLHRLLESVNPKKLLFSSDFPCNWKDVRNLTDLEWGSKKRVVEAALDVGLSREDIDEILSKNAINFFKL